MVMPPERLEFTFAWETPNHEDGPDVQTRVIVCLEALANGGTRMQFSQTGFLTKKSATSHSAGWTGTFNRLADFFLDETVSQPSELSPTETPLQICSLSDGGSPCPKCA